MFKLFGGKKFKKGHLGQESSLYYNEKLKRWVERGKEDEAEKDAEPPPPPTTLNNSLSRQSIMSDPGPTSTGSVNSTIPDSGPPSGPGVPISKRSLISQRYVATGFNTTTTKGSAPPVTAFVPAATAAKPPPATFFLPKPVSNNDGTTGTDESKVSKEQQPPSNPFSNYFQPPSKQPPADPEPPDQPELLDTDKQETVPAEQPLAAPPIQEQQQVFASNDSGVEPGPSAESGEQEAAVGDEALATAAVFDSSGDAIAEPVADSAATDYTHAAAYSLEATAEGGGSTYAAYGLEPSPGGAVTTAAAYGLEATGEGGERAVYDNAVWGGYSADQAAEPSADSASYDQSAVAANGTYQFDWSQWGDYSTWTQEQIDYYNSYMAYYATQGQTPVDMPGTTQPECTETVSTVQADPIPTHTEQEAMSIGYASWQADSAADLSTVAHDTSNAWPADDVTAVTSASADGWHVHDTPADLIAGDVEVLEPAVEEEVAELSTPIFTDIPLDALPNGKGKATAQHADDDSASSQDGSAVSEQSSLPETNSNHLFAPLNWIKQKTQASGGKLVGMPWDNVNPVDYDEYWNETPDDILEHEGNGNGSSFGLKPSDGIQSPETTMVNAIQTSPPPKAAGNFGLFSTPLFGSLQPAGNSLPKSVTPTSSVYASSPLLKQPRSTDATSYDSLMAAAQQTPTKGYVQPVTPKDTPSSKDVAPGWGPPPPAAPTHEPTPAPNPLPSDPAHPTADNSYAELSHTPSQPAVPMDSHTTDPVPSNEVSEVAFDGSPELVQHDIAPAAEEMCSAVVDAVGVGGQDAALSLPTESESERPVWPGPNGWEYVEGADYGKYSYWPDFTAWGDQSTWDAERLQIYSEWYYGCQYFQYQQSVSQANSQQGLSAEVSTENLGQDTTATTEAGMTPAETAAAADADEALTDVAALDPTWHASQGSEACGVDHRDVFDQDSQTMAPGVDLSYGPQLVGEPSTSKAGPPSQNSHNGDPGRMLAPERHTYDDMHADDMDDGYTPPDGPAARDADKTQGWTAEQDLLHELTAGVDDGADAWHPTLPALVEQAPHAVGTAAAGPMLSPLHRDSSALQAATTPQPPHTPPRDDHTVNPAYVDEEPAALPTPAHAVHAHNDAASSQPTTSSTLSTFLPADTHQVTTSPTAGTPHFTHDTVSSLPSTSGASHTASLSNASTSATTAAGISPMPLAHEKHPQHAPDYPTPTGPAAPHEAYRPGTTSWEHPATQDDVDVDFFDHLGEASPVNSIQPTINTLPDQPVFVNAPTPQSSHPPHQPATTSTVYDPHPAATYTAAPTVAVYDVSAHQSEEAEFFDHLGQDQDDDAADVSTAGHAEALQPVVTPFSVASSAPVNDAAESSSLHTGVKSSHPDAIDQAFDDPDAFFTGLLAMDSASTGLPTPTPVTAPAADPSVAFFDQPEMEMPQAQQAEAHAVPAAQHDTAAGTAASSAHGHTLTPERSSLDGCASPSGTTATVNTLDTVEAAAPQLPSTAQSTTSGHTTPTTHAAATAETTPAATPATPSSPSHPAAGPACADDVASSSDTAASASAAAPSYLYDWSQNPRPDWSAWGPKDSWDDNAQAMYDDWVRWRREQQKLRRKAGAKKAQQGATPVDSSATTPEHSAPSADVVAVSAVHDAPQASSAGIAQLTTHAAAQDVPQHVESAHDQPGPSAPAAASSHEPAAVHSKVDHTPMHEVNPPSSESEREIVHTSEAAPTVAAAAVVQETEALVEGPPVLASSQSVAQVEAAVAAVEPATQEPEWAELAQELEEDVWGAGMGASEEGPSAYGSGPSEPSHHQLDPAAESAAELPGDVQSAAGGSNEISARVEAYNEKLERFVQEREALVDEYLNLVDEGVEDIEMPDEKDNDGVQELLGNLGKASAQVELLLKFCRDNGLDGEALLRDNGMWE